MCAIPDNKHGHAHPTSNECATMFCWGDPTEEHEITSTTWWYPISLLFYLTTYGIHALFTILSFSSTAFNGVRWDAFTETPVGTVNGTAVFVITPIQTTWYITSGLQILLFFGGFVVWPILERYLAKVEGGVSGVEVNRTLFGVRPMQTHLYFWVALVLDVLKTLLIHYVDTPFGAVGTPGTPISPWSIWVVLLIETALVGWMFICTHSLQFWHQYNAHLIEYFLIHVPLGIWFATSLLSWGDMTLRALIYGGKSVDHVLRTASPAVLIVLTLFLAIFFAFASWRPWGGDADGGVRPYGGVPWPLLFVIMWNLGVLAHYGGYADDATLSAFAVIGTVICSISFFCTVLLNFWLAGRDDVDISSRDRSTYIRMPFLEKFSLY